ncbi:MAG: hypothetical protein ACLUUO_10215 [Sellimonas intestinalis]
MYRILYGMLEFDGNKALPEEQEAFCTVLETKYQIERSQTEPVIRQVLKTAFGKGRTEKTAYRELKNTLPPGAGEDSGEKRTFPEISVPLWERILNKY